MSEYQQLTALDHTERAETSRGGNPNAMLLGLARKLAAADTGITAGGFGKLQDTSEYSREVIRQLNDMGSFDLTDTGWTFRLAVPIVGVNELELGELALNLPDADMVEGIGAHGKYRHAPWRNLWLVAKCAGHQNTSIVERIPIGDYLLIADVLDGHILHRFGGVE